MNYREKKWSLLDTKRRAIRMIENRGWYFDETDWYTHKKIFGFTLFDNYREFLARKKWWISIRNPKGFR